MLRKLRKFGVRWVIACLTLVLFLSIPSVQNAGIPGLPGGKIALADASEPTASEQPSASYQVFMPLNMNFYPWSSPFGIEIIQRVDSQSLLLERATSIPARWIRLNGRISWRLLQPNEGDTIKWGLLGGFETELRALKAANMIPIVTVDDYPAWATTERWPGTPSLCGPLRSDKFQAFADFVIQLVNRYKAREFNVHVWELGNEPDIDANVYALPLNSMYGCWGDASDPNYGGQLYGEMLKVVTPVIKYADPIAQVWLGGLLLNSPLTTKSGEGRPELFLRGILQAGVGGNYSYFDVVPFHTYTIYRGLSIDYDNGDPQSPWYGSTWEGSIKGKTQFLRDIMNAYGVQKPLFVDEISLTCVAEYNPALCNPPVEAFLQMQASHLVRVQTRGLSEGIFGFTWYTLDGPGWRNGNLLDTSGDPLPSYLANQQMAQELAYSSYVAPVNYGAAFEAYAFRRGAQDVHIVWSKEDLQGLTILVPESKFIEARSRDGMLMTPALVDGKYQIPVGFSPVYVIRRP